MKKEISNNTGFTLEEISKFSFLGRVRNNWRQRDVTLLQHPTDESKVISIGTGYNGGNSFICLEDKSSWTIALDYASRGKVYTIN